MEIAPKGAEIEIDRDGVHKYCDQTELRASISPAAREGVSEPGVIFLLSLWERLGEGPDFVGIATGVIPSMSP